MRTNPNYEGFLTYGIWTDKKKDNKCSYFHKDSLFLILDYMKVHDIDNLRNFPYLELIQLERKFSFSIPIKFEYEEIDFDYFRVWLNSNVMKVQVLTEKVMYFLTLGLAAFILEKFSRDGKQEFEKKLKEIRERRSKVESVGKLLGK